MPAYRKRSRRLPLSIAVRPPNVLIPGCGSAYEALWLARENWPVKAIDFSSSAVAAAREQLGEYAGVVEQADFFAHRPPFDTDWIYERAFLCTLLRDRWHYAVRMAELLRPGALLAGFYFLGETPRPPFGIERGTLDALLTSYFELVEEHEVTGSIDVFAERERWLTWCGRRSESDARWRRRSEIRNDLVLQNGLLTTSRGADKQVSGASEGARRASADSPGAARFLRG